MVRRKQKKALFINLVSQAVFAKVKTASLRPVGELTLDQTIEHFIGLSPCSDYK